MILKVNANWPEDMEELENRAAEELAKILAKKLQPKEIDELVEILNDDSIQLKI